MEGIAEVLEKPTYEVMLMNTLYELDAYCTTLVVRMHNGTLMLARNLDFYFPNASRKVLYIARFHRGEKFLYEASMFAGVVGVYTGYRPNAFAIAINERTSKESSLPLMGNIGMIWSGAGE